jgi:ATP-binding cassette subfamily B protein
VALRKELVEVDNTRNGFFIDSILNQEVIKLFTAEQREAQRFDGYLRRQEQLSIKSTYAIALLNLGQALLFCAGLTTSLVLALQRVLAGSMTVGDLVAVNSLLLQLSIPFNFIGYTYQELRQAFVDMGYMRGVLTTVQPRVVDSNWNVSFDDLHPTGTGARAVGSSVEFRNVTLRQTPRDGEATALAQALLATEGEGQYVRVPTTSGKGKNSTNGGDFLLQEVSFTVQPGQSVALVGPSGSGKSTTLRLITRMLDASAGNVIIDGVDIRNVSLQSLRARVSVVPQDNSLFDETIEYNIRYGRPDATDSQLSEAVAQCNLAATIAKLPDGLQTRVGERGQRLSGGERQKVSIARALLKDPSLILCDEVTSAVDAFAERDIVDTLRKAGTSI